MPTKVAIHGAAGRMGGRLVALGTQDPEIELAAALDATTHPARGKDAGVQAGIGAIGIPITDQLPDGLDAVIDFSVPEAVIPIVDACCRQRVPLVLATTGLEANHQARIAAATAEIPICSAPNMSLAVNLLMKLSEVAAQALADHPTGADVEIIERHHRFKEDAPSGTALAFGDVIAAQMGHLHHQHGRSGRPGVRPHSEIGYHALRAGDNPGEHTIVFGLLGETIELRVAATNRDCYAQGALVAARWICGKPPALYNMHDVLGL